MSGLSTVWTFHYFCAAGCVGECCPSSLRLLLTGQTFETRPDDAAGLFQGSHLSCTDMSGVM